MKRGLLKRGKKPIVKELLAKPAHLSGLAYLPKGVYEFHHHRQLLNQPDGVEKVARLKIK